jgi:hypothetical protein
MADQFCQVLINHTNQIINASIETNCFSVSKVVKNTNSCIFVEEE